MKKSIVDRLLTPLFENYQSIDFAFELIIQSLNELHSQIKGHASALASGAFCWQPKDFKEAYDRNLDCCLWEDFCGIQDKLSGHQITLRESLRKLSLLREELADLRLSVDKRGYGIFKCGNLKTSMDATLSKQMIHELQDDMQSCLDAFSAVHQTFESTNNKTTRPIFEWLINYNQKQAKQQRTHDNKQNSYEVILNV